MAKRIKEPGPYVFESDDDGHFYVIPLARLKDWYAWLESEDAQDGIEPEWAHIVGGNPSLICFPDFANSPAPDGGTSHG